MPLELRQEFSAFIKMPEPDLALIDVTIPEAELAAAGGVVSRDFITKALEAKAVATLAQLSPDKDPNLDPTVVFKKNSSDTLGAKAADAHSVSSASSEAEPKLFTSTTRTLGVGGRPIFEVSREPRPAFHMDRSLTCFCCTRRRTSRSRWTRWIPI
jgi:hypothetical protein